MTKQREGNAPEHNELRMNELERRLHWLKKIVIVGLLAGIFLSLKMWVGQRFFPLAPVFGNVPAIPGLLQTALFAALICSLVVALISSKPRKAIFSALLIAAIFALADQMRWQPWFYQYCFMLAAIGLYSWKQNDEDGRLTAINTCRLIVACVYVYAGLQKMNFGFFGGIFPWMVGPLMRFVPSNVYLFPPLLGLAAPLVEMGIGIGLLTKKFRKPAVIASAGMTAFILLALGPLGHNWNSVIWPWTVAMALFTVVLFWKAEDFSWKEVLWSKNAWFQKVALVLFGIMPMLSFFNLWDSYLSAALYSGNVNAGKLYVSEGVKSRLPAPVLAYVRSASDKGNELRYYEWSFGELNVPPYPESRIFKAIAREVCTYAESPNDVTLEIAGKPTPFNADHPSAYDCAKLQASND